MISIISAYYKNEAMTILFLENLMSSLKHYSGDYEVILVNAGSEPIEFPNVKRIDLPVNESFSNSFNNGIINADPSSEFIIILGNDVFPDNMKDWITPMLKVHELTNASIIAPISAEPRLEQYKRFFIKEFDEYIATNFYPAICWMIPRKVIDTVGLFDERFKIGCYEDNDYCKRVLLSKGSIVVCKGVIVKHILSSTFKLFDSKTIMSLNKMRYLEKWNEQ